MKCTKKEIKTAINKSVSLAELLKNLNIGISGGNYATIKTLIKKFKLNTSHFLGQAINKGKKFGYKRSIEDYLSNKIYITSHALRLRLLEEKYFEHKCYSCGLKKWLGKPIPLELEHKNGIHEDNTLENLTLFCSNCHALSPFYCGKNKNSKNVIASKKLLQNKLEKHG